MYRNARPRVHGSRLHTSARYTHTQRTVTTTVARRGVCIHTRARRRRVHLALLTYHAAIWRRGASSASIAHRSAGRDASTEVLYGRMLNSGTKAVSSRCVTDTLCLMRDLALWPWALRGLLWRGGSQSITRRCAHRATRPCCVYWCRGRIPRAARRAATSGMRASCQRAPGWAAA